MGGRMALTVDVFRPTGHANGAGIILVCSGGWFYDRFDLYLPQSPPATSPSKP